MARFHRLLVPVLGVALATAGCGGKQVEEIPEPVATPAPAPAPVSAPVVTPVTVEPRTPAPDTRRMALEERIHFELDRSDLTATARTTLSAKAEILRSSPQVTLRIDGHADERGSDEYNLALSKRRASEAKRFLVSQGVDASRLEVVAHGEERPIDAASTEAAWAANRRADFSVSSGAVSQR